MEPAVVPNHLSTSFAIPDTLLAHFWRFSFTSCNCFRTSCSRFVFSAGVSTFLGTSLLLLPCSPEFDVPVFMRDGFFVTLPSPVSRVGFFSFLSSHVPGSREFLSFSALPVPGTKVGDTVSEAFSPVPGVGAGLSFVAKPVGAIGASGTGSGFILEVSGIFSYQRCSAAIKPVSPFSVFTLI